MYLKKKVFEEELSWYHNEQIKNFALEAVNCLPDYFFEVAASSTGKYHSQTCLGSGGLVRHTKAALMIAHDSFRANELFSFTEDMQDCIYTALMLHDGWKHGNSLSKFTVFDHPIVARDNLQTLYNSGKLSQINIEHFNFICEMISAHMGQWNTSNRSKTILPKPETEAQRFVHMCDYYASRTYLTYVFAQPYEPKDFVFDDSAMIAEEASSLITLCKQLIDNGVSRDSIYEIITRLNNGVRNPIKAQSVDVVRAIRREVELLA